MPVLDPHHDLAHPVEGDGAWSESYYFNAYDPGTDTGFFTRIGIRPNEGTMDVGLSVWLPGDELAEYRSVGEQHTMVERDLTVGAVRYRMIEPMAAWELTMDGEARIRPCRGDTAPRTAHVRVAATFGATGPAVGVDGQGGSGPSRATSAAAATVGKGHLEQAGRWEGTVEVDGTVHRWTGARGNRDRSWGPRRWGGPRMWRWFSVNIADDVAFGGIRLDTGAGDLHRGWVWEGGRAVSLREWDVRTETEADGHTHRRLEVTAVDKEGGRHHLVGEVLRVAAIGRPASGGPVTVVNEGLTRWHYGGRTGYGIAEYLHQLDADGAPVVAVA